MGFVVSPKSHVGRLAAVQHALRAVFPLAKVRLEVGPETKIDRQCEGVGRKYGEKNDGAAHSDGSDNIAEQLGVQKLPRGAR